MTRQTPIRPSSTLPRQQPPSTASHPPPPPSSRSSSSDVDPAAYTQPFLSFISSNPTVYHAVAHFSARLTSHGFTKLSERDLWTDSLARGGKYFYDRNGSGLIAFTVGKNYKPGNGLAIIASHIDALTTKLKPVSTKPTKAGYVQLGVAQYGGALNQTWIDRDLGIGGRVIVMDEESGKVVTRLVKLDWPIARIPSLAPHFGIPAEGQANRETRMVPIIGLDNSDIGGKAGGIEQEQEQGKATVLGGAGSFASTQPERLLKVIAGEMGIKKYENILNWDLEVFDTQPAQLGGLDKEFIFAGRIDDKLCSFAAIEALIESSSATSSSNPSSSGGETDSGIITLATLFDDEEVGSLLRQGARSNFLPSTISRILEAFAGAHSGPNLLSQTAANSFMISADVTHAVNPNYLDAYLEGHMPRLNVGVCVAADSNAHMTTDALTTTLLTRIAALSASTLQVFQIRNDSRSGGTVGPMLSAATGIRAIDAGIPQLSMHSIRATTGSLDPGLGVRLFRGFYDRFEAVDGAFR